VKEEMIKQLEKNYRSERHAYCKAMIAALNRLSELAAKDPIDKNLYNTIVEESGVTRNLDDTQKEFEDFFEDTMGETVDKFVSMVIPYINKNIEIAQSSVEYVQQHEPKVLKPGESDSGFNDFQHTIHEGPEKHIGLLAKYLPKNDSCKKDLAKAKEKYHDAATFFINPDRALAAGLDFSNNSNDDNNNNSPTP
jgi:hypothetical protein